MKLNQGFGLLMITSLIGTSLLAACGGQAPSASDGGSASAGIQDLTLPLTVDEVLANVDIAFREAANQALGAEDSSLVDSHSAAGVASLEMMRQKIGMGKQSLGGGVPGRSSGVVVAAGGGNAPMPGIALAIGLTWGAATRGNEKPPKDSDLYDPSLDTIRTANADIDIDQTKTQVKTTFTPEGPTATADSDIKVTTSGSDGALLVDTARAHVHGDVCPDPSGVVRVDYTLVWNVNAKGRYGTDSLHVDASGQGTGQVDDEAGVGSITADGSATFGIGSTLGTSAHREGTFTFETKANQPSLTKGSGALPPGFSGAAVDSIRDLPYKLVRIYMEFAEDAWSSGSCVEIHASGVDAPDLTYVAAASTKSFVGTVFHRWDNKTPTFPLEATLQGDRALTPTGKQSAPVNYSYVAPNDIGQQATIHLESRSRRGVAKLDIPLFTGQHRYVASGGQHVEMSGTIPDLTKPFDLTGTGGDGVEYTFHFAEWPVHLRRKSAGVHRSRRRQV